MKRVAQNEDILLLQWAELTIEPRVLPRILMPDIVALHAAPCVYGKKRYIIKERVYERMDPPLRVN